MSIDHRLDGLEERRLLSVSINAEGWTEVTPHATTTVIYVSSSEGSDSNSGLSAAAPVQTLSQAASLTDSGDADWILLKKGDVWYESFGRWQKSGFNADNPFLISSYGDPAAARPVLRTGTEEAIYSLAPDDIHDIAIIGLHFQAHTRDTDSPFFVSKDGKDGVRWLGKGSNLLIEDTRIESYENNIVMQSADGWTGFDLRRNTIIDAYATGQHSQGVFIKNVSDILLEGNVIDHNGWNESIAGAEATVFNHNIYIQVHTWNVEVRDNIISRASSHGLQARSGGIIEGNLFFENPLGMTFGAVRGGAESEVTGTVDGQIFGNVVLNGTDIGEQPRGTGIQIGNAGKVFMFDNVIAHTNTDGGNNRGLYLDGDANFGIDELTIDGNVIHNWGEAVRIIGEADEFNDVNFVNNILSGEYDDDFAIQSSAPITNTFYFEGNTYYLPNRDPEKINELQGSSKSISEWAALMNEAGATGADPLFADPNANLTAYDGTAVVEGTQITLVDNAWKKMDLPYLVTRDTYITFEFQSTEEGEIHGIGFDDDNENPGETRKYQLLGTQTSLTSIQDHNHQYNVGDGWKEYTIFIGDDFVGNINYVTFINDNDDPDSDGITQIRNLKIGEIAGATMDVDFTTANVTSYSNQDGDGYYTVSATTPNGGFLNNVRANSRDTWDAKYTAEMTNAYFQTAFNLTVRDEMVITTEEGTQVKLVGNAWKKLDMPYVVTRDSYVTFEFRSTEEGEIHGIGFDDDNENPGETRKYQLFGTQTSLSSIQTYRNYSLGDDWKEYTIFIGDDFTGPIQYLVLINDNDSPSSNGVTEIRNFRIGEIPTFTTAVDFTTATITGYSNQDGNGTVSTSGGYTSITLTGNAWKKIDLLPYNVVASSYLTFEFRSTQEGEIQGIGFDDDNNNPGETRKFQLFGTQISLSSVQTYNDYDPTDEWKTYVIPIGSYFTGTVNYLTLINDNDLPASNGDSAFRNIQFGDFFSGTTSVDLQAAIVSGYSNQDLGGSAVITLP